MGILDGFLDMMRAARDAAGSTRLVHHLDLTQRDLVAIYGDPGIGRAAADPSWERANIITCRDKNGHLPSLPGVPARLYLQIHRKAEPYAREALQAARDACPEHTIERAGCYVFRHQRHDPARPLSRHAWGCAIDIDADDNSARQFAPGKTPAPWSAAWREVWPRGLPQLFVVAMEAHGWEWGGRWRGFVDPMHFQLAVRP